MNKSLKVVLIVVGVLALMGLVGGTAAFLVTRSAADADEYKIGNDVVPSVKSVLGKRSVTSVSTEKNNDLITVSYTYSKIDKPQEEILAYAKYLNENNGFLATSDYDLTTPTGKMQLGVESVDPGKIILMDIQWDLGTYSIVMRLGKGTLTIRQ